ncbi:hypothetical protein DFJ63DRAFT_337655 [Scheffersomyces coipomensis]|uniref:uncharacterized protein n=1 Tax=Scheffersomyces coipomensis TaxID=1788519 RepID=UPI00315C720C
MTTPSKSVYIPINDQTPLSFFLDLGPLCSNENYAECHQLAQDNFMRCDEDDKSCCCYYINVVHQECRQLCSTFHHETYYRLKALCSKVDYQTIIDTLPAENIGRIIPPSLSNNSDSTTTTTSSTTTTSTTNINQFYNNNKTKLRNDWKSSYPKHSLDYDYYNSEEGYHHYHQSNSNIKQIINSKLFIGLICILIPVYIFNNM